MFFTDFFYRTKPKDEPNASMNSGKPVVVGANFERKHAQFFQNAVL